MWRDGCEDTQSSIHFVYHYGLLAILSSYSSHSFRNAISRFGLYITYGAQLNSLGASPAQIFSNVQIYSFLIVFLKACLNLLSFSGAGQRATVLVCESSILMSFAAVQAIILHDRAFILKGML